jgi:hypothetical protein
MTMASVTTRWWGVEVRLSHGEVCLWTSSAVNNLGMLIASKVGGAWGAAVAAVIVAFKTYIRNLCKTCGGSGVKLKFAWTGTYLGVNRRGFGTAPSC